MTEYTWKSTGERVLLKCPKCGGKTEHLRVSPERSYTKEIFMCLTKGCRYIIGDWNVGESVTKEV